MEAIGYFQSEKAFVTRLRVRASGIDPIRTRLRIANLLNNSYAQPTGLSPAAIVFVRRLTDPLPGSLQLRSQQLNPPVAWQRALTSALDQSLTKAARPGLAIVPAAADCVVFSDRSELLACLASDWCEARIATQWWWQSFLRQGDADQVFWKVWRSSPEYVPAALEHLARWGKAVDFMRALGDAPAYEVLRAVVERFGLNTLIPVLGYQPGTEFSQFKTSEQRDHSPTSLVEHEMGDGSQAGQILAPWRSSVPESSADGLGVGQQLLLGIGLMLQRAPAKVRAPGFAREIDRWRREIAGLAAIEFISDKQRNNENRTRGNDENRAQRKDAPRQPGELRAEDFSVDSSLPSRNEKSRARSTVLSGEDRARDKHTTDLSVEAVAPAEIEKEFAASPSETSDQPLTASDARLHEDLAGSREELKADPQSQAAIAANSDPLVNAAPTETQFGGVFYLINLALYLGLYGDFTTPAEPGIELDIWDFVALVGRELNGEQIESDPVWACLARLAGRENDEQLGNGFCPEDEWRMPSDWLEPFSDGRLNATTDQGRLLVFHSDGFLVIDVPLDTNDYATQLQLELSAYEDAALAVATLLAREDPFPKKVINNRYLDFKESTQPDRKRDACAPVIAIEVWLSRLMPYVRGRLRKALGLLGTEDPSAVVCRQSARVCVTPTHIDVFFVLAELPIELRRAGLDRNPGWVPAAGRFIEFHFE